jgi:hypothetical protein
MLLHPDGEPNDPLVLNTTTVYFEVDDIITVGGQQRRVVAVLSETPDGLAARGFGGLLIVEPVG